eukprot:12890978-Prorocentrum_lima.AAC.1
MREAHRGITRFVAKVADRQHRHHALISHGAALECYQPRSSRSSTLLVIAMRAVLTCVLLACAVLRHSCFFRS